MWYYQQNNQTVGPVSEDVIRQLIRSGTITRDSYIWTDGMADWRTASNTMPFATDLPQSHAPPPITRRSPAAITPQPRRFGRGPYVLSVIGIGLVSSIFSNIKGAEILGVLISLGCFVPVVFRLHDIGKSGWWSLVSFVPLANLVLGYHLLCAPTGYAQTKQPDKTMKVLSIVFIGFIALIILLAILIPIFAS